jgi:AcrR family transcriptional regulator
MGRWKPDARTRLAEAALELYGQRGFQAVTVAEIAERAGLTERTFFRHFADKREVLFSAAGGLQDQVTRALDNAPVSLSAIDAVGEALQAAAALLGQRRDYARRRQAIITANAELQERERIKLASLASALAGGLRQRGVGDPAAILAAEAGIAVFRVAFERWIDESEHRELWEVISDSLKELKAVTARRRVRLPRHPQ